MCRISSIRFISASAVDTGAKRRLKSISQLPGTTLPRAGACAHVRNLERRRREKFVAVVPTLRWLVQRVPARPGALGYGPDPDRRRGPECRATTSLARERSASPVLDRVAERDRRTSAHRRCSSRSFRRVRVSASTTLTVPSVAGPSSSEVKSRAIEPRCAAFSLTNCSAATTNAATELFMSAAPRPYSVPLRIVGLNGSDDHLSSGPEGTTSV